MGTLLLKFNFLVVNKDKASHHTYFMKNQVALTSQTWEQAMPS